MKRAFITGLSGQDGSFLAELLLAKDYEVWGLLRRSSSTNTQRIDHILDRLHVVVGDMTDSLSLARAIEMSQPDEVYNLAAQSQVQVSFEMPEYTSDVVGLGPVRILEILRSSRPDTRFYQASCYDCETRVLTADGLKRYDEVKIGDVVFTTNTETNALEMKPVRRVITSHYDGEMIRISGKRLDLLVTLNHRLLLHGQRTGLFYTEAGDLRVPKAECFYDRSSTVKLPTPQWHGTTQKTLRLSQIAPCHPPSNTTKNLLDEIEVDDLFWIAGLYIGDGYCAPDRTAWRSCDKSTYESAHDARGHFIAREKTELVTYPNHNLYFAIPVNDKARQRLLDWVRKYGVDFRSSDMWIRFSSYTLAHFLRTCGTGVYKKRIPDWMLRFAPCHLRKLFNGLIDSDGHIRRDVSVERYSYTTASSRLHEQIVELALKLGMKVSSSWEPPGDKFFGREQRAIRSRGAYRLCFSQNHDIRPLTLYPSHLSREHYNGTVWCLEVEDNHNFLVERNGKFAFCGNSSELFGKVHETPQRETTAFHPRSPYASAKAHAFYAAKNYREAYGLFAVNGILYNHESARRGEEFVTRKITRAATRIKMGLQDKLKLGNLDSKRDWGFAGDFIEAMWLMLQAEKPDDYVIATGEAHSVREFVELTFDMLALDWQRYVEYDRDLLRPAEVDYLCGDASKASRELGWSPKVSFAELVRMMVESDLELARREAQG